MKKLLKLSLTTESPKLQLRGSVQSVDDVMVLVHQGENSNNKWGTQDGIQFTNIDDLSIEDVLALTRENKS